MKQFLIIFIATSFWACNPFEIGTLSQEELFEQCPYEYEYSSAGEYILEVPMKIIPHQKTYKVGDTITIRMMFSDSILDLNRGERYKIEDFPFRPMIQLYLVKNNEWSSGFRENTFAAPEIYNATYRSATSWADDIRGFSVYENGIYHFELTLVVLTPGVYITHVIDGVIFAHPDDISQGYPPPYNIDFEGKCPNRFWNVATRIQGDDHIEDYIEELQLLDEQVYRGALTFLGGDPLSPLGNGRFAVDWRGVYCFEVEE